MLRPAAWFFVTAALATTFVGCKRLAGLRRSDAGTAATPAPNGAMTVTIGTTTVATPRGRATLTDRGLSIELSSAAIGCDTMKTDARTGTSVGIEIPSGPDGKYYAGKSFGLAVRIAAPSADSYDTPATMTRIVLEPFEAKHGAHVRGSVAAEGGMQWAPKDVLPHTAKGIFDAVVCTDERTNKIALRARVRLSRRGAERGLRRRYLPVSGRWHHVREPEPKLTYLGRRQPRRDPARYAAPGNRACRCPSRPPPRQRPPLASRANRRRPPRTCRAG